MLESYPGAAGQERAEVRLEPGARRITAAVILEVTMIAELVVAVPLAQGNRQDLTLAFSRVFLSALVPALCVWGGL
jgi:hypothetical protein